MTQVALTGMPGYPGITGGLNALTGGEYVHGVQNQSGTWVDVAIRVGFFGRFVNVLSFPGVDPTGTTDSTSGMNAAHATGNLVYYPAGIYKATSTFSFAQGGAIGDGQSQTVLNLTDISSNDLMTITGYGAATPCLFKDMTIMGSPSKTAGSALRFLGSSGTTPLYYPYLSNVQLLNIPVGAYFSNSTMFQMDGCNIINYAAAGVHIENTITSDQGDSCMSNCFFNTSVPNGTCNGIWQRSSGGLKLSNIKILGGNNGYVMGWIGTNSADLLASNMSIEDCTGYAMYLGRDSGSGAFGSVILNGLELACNQGIATDTSGFLTLLTMQGHIIDLQSTTGTCISLNNVSNFNIGNGVLNAQVGAGSTVGINIVSNCSNGKIAPQTFVNIPAANRIINGSSSVLYQEQSQTGTAGTIATSTAYGALFEGGVAVTFPQAYSVAPKVTCNVSNGSGGAVAAWASGITTTGFTATAVGVTSGGSVTGVTWTATGGVI
jgi:hypothetical protein